MSFYSTDMWQYIYVQYGMHRHASISIQFGQTRGERRLGKKKTPQGDR